MPTTGTVRQRRTRRPGWATCIAAAAAVAGLALASCSAPGPAAKPAAAGTRVISLAGIGALRSVFNHDAGHPRLVLIFSPT